MARRPSGTGRSSRPPAAAAMPPGAGTESPGSGAQSARERIVAALLSLLADRSFEEIGLADVAAEAGVTLGELRAEFSSTVGIYAAHVKATDRQVLDGGESDVGEESPRERLFDVLMRRLDALAPHKAALRSLLRSARRNPPLALALNGMAVRSQQWMLAAAGIDSSGPRGALRAQGLALLFAKVLRVWLDDDDPGLARTMAELDRELGRGQRLAGALDCLCRLAPPLRRRRRAEDGHQESASPAA